MENTVGSYRGNDTGVKHITGDLESLELTKFDTTLEDLVAQPNALELLENRLSKLKANKTALYDELNNHKRWEEEIALRGKMLTKQQESSSSGGRGDGDENGSVSYNAGEINDDTF